MNKHLIYAQLSVKLNRKELIRNIEKGISQKVNKDPEVEKFQLEFLQNWKDYDKSTRLEFCEWILDSSDKGYAYGYQRKEDIKESIKRTPGNIISKVKSAISKLKEDESKDN